MISANNNFETLLNEHDVARITVLSVASVRRWRLLRKGPKYIKIGAAVRYRREDLDAWLASRPTGGSGTQLAASCSLPALIPRVLLTGMGWARPY
jgi:predicted DNA-binding transcriptional regulator AlpA